MINKEYIHKEIATIEHKGITYEVTGYRINNDYYGNPRYVFHFMDLNLKEYDFSSRLQFGLKKYVAKWFGGGYVIQSYNFKESIKDIIEALYN